ncbi:MAG: hypothetical protein AOA65_0873 [Candidatus Bathyarchaeota archaeon BA1]|nr:MAG: hypothetical protein AOA65_0873 [Candidatus Bathyarchaeota archaeon BA1]
MIDPTIVGTLIAASFTVMVYSFFYKENPVYRFAEHIFVGLAVAHAIVIASKYVIDKAWTPLVTKGEYIWAVPLLIGLLYCFFFSKKHFWLYRIPVAMIVGTGVGLAMAGLMKTQFVDQIIATVKIPDWGKPWWDMAHPINALLIAIGIVGTLCFFIFTKEQKGPLLHAARVGKWTMMVAFGAAFGFTVMARMSLLIGRMTFLLDPKTVAWYVIPIAIVVIITATIWGRLKSPAKG